MIVFALFCLTLASCSDGRVYQEYADFNEREWLVTDTAEFRFDITDTTAQYNVFCNLRNSTVYPYSRIFINFSLSDTASNSLHQSLVSDFLFDPKTGEPLGKTGLGDLYDHQLRVLGGYKFPHRGQYTARLQQFMRTDTLEGVLSVGIEVSKVQ